MIDALTALRNTLGVSRVREQRTADQIPTAWIHRDDLRRAADLLRDGVEKPYRFLYDLTAIDERRRRRRDDQPASDFTAVYQLLSLDRNDDVRLKVALAEDDATLPSLTGHWRNAAWYEREVWDMFGVHFDGHPDLRRILLPPTWDGHPLRKSYAARATDHPRFELTAERRKREENALRLEPPPQKDGSLGSKDGSLSLHRPLILNVGPQHPGTHGVLRIALTLDGESIVDAVPDIGYHHRGAEKMAERQTWHTYIPYTDRVDYLGGVNNNMPYVAAVEKLAGIVVPDRARLIRIMLCELFRIASHLVWYGTFAQDLGALAPIFYMFADRERVLDVIEAICGARMHPGWFRIGGVAQDLPRGWEELLRGLLDYLPHRLDEYDHMVLGNRIFQERTVGVGSYSAPEAIEWGVTGPGLRACGVAWDWRKARPYGGYDQLDFEIPTSTGGDCYARAEVRVAEMRQSLRIVRQCVDQMPGGPVMASHPASTPPPKPRTLHDIETLIHHFLGVSWGPVVPDGECAAAVEGTKGVNGYYVVSDRDIHPYRLRIRSPSFPHLQMLPAISRGLFIPDLLAILGSIDYVLADVDR